MKTTKSQISDLYAFTQKHFVEYYDLQTELVDHLANDIEAIRENSPSLSFEQARDISFKKFGVYGFAEIVEKREKAMNKRYWKYIWYEFKQWFTVPKLVMTVALFLMFYSLLSTPMSKYVFGIFYFSLIVWALYKTITLNRQFRRRREQTDKKWLLENIIFKQAAGTNLVVISQFYNVIQFSDKTVENQLLLVLFSMLITASILLLYISYHVLPKKAEQLLKETYPEFSL